MRRFLYTARTSLAFAERARAWQSTIQRGAAFVADCSPRSEEIAGYNQAAGTSIHAINMTPLLPDSKISRSMRTSTEADIEFKVEIELDASDAMMAMLTASAAFAGLFSYGEHLISGYNSKTGTTITSARFNPPANAQAEPMQEPDL